MTYKLNDIDFSSYGLFPARAENSNIAITGCWDLPARINTTGHDWGDENGIEDYTEEGQIFLGGRTITLDIVLSATSKYEATTKVSNFYKAVNSFTDLVVLSTFWGDFNVYVNGKFTITYVRSGKARVKLSFREPVVDLSASGGYIEMEAGGSILEESGDVIETENSNSGIISTGSSTGIDGISFPDLGIMPLAFTGILNRPEPKPQFFKSYENEGYQVTTRKEREDVLTALITAPDYATFLFKIKRLYSFFTQPGTHYINYFNDLQRYFYVKDGFTVRNVYIKGSAMSAQISINITETGILQPFMLLTDDGTTISTDTDFSLDTDDFYYQTEF